MTHKEPPLFPAGEYLSPGIYSETEKRAFVYELAQFPAQLQKCVEDLDDAQLDSKYKNWTIRQIVHHIADSHINSYVRFKWALTEASPLIKTYNESLWSEIVDARAGSIEPSLVILEGIHGRWSQLILELSDDEMKMNFFHPELMSEVSLYEALPSYVWHGKHHMAQIQWLRSTNQW